MTNKSTRIEGTETAPRPEGPIEVWTVGRDYQPCRGWAFYSPARPGWVVYDGEGMVMPKHAFPEQTNGLPWGAFLTLEEAVDAALELTERDLRDLLINEPRRIELRRLEMMQAIERLEREVALGE